MKNLFKVLTLCTAMVFTLVSAQAQKVSIEEKVKKETDGIVAALELDEEMAQKIYDINLNAAKEKKAVNKAYKAKKKAGEEVDKEARKAEMKPIGKAQNVAIKKMLTKDQVKAYNRYKKEQRELRKKTKE